MENKGKIAYEDTYKVVVRLYDEGKSGGANEMERAVFDRDGNCLYSERGRWDLMKAKKTVLGRFLAWLDGEESGYNRGHVPGHAKNLLHEAWVRFSDFLREFLQYARLLLKCRYLRLKNLALKFYLKAFCGISTFGKDVVDFRGKAKMSADTSDAKVPQEAISEESTQ